MSKHQVFNLILDLFIPNSYFFVFIFFEIIEILAQERI